MGLNRDLCKQRYYDLKAQHRCVRCAQKLAVGETRVRCLECHTDMLLTIDKGRNVPPEPPPPPGGVRRCEVCSLAEPHECMSGSATRRREWA